MRTAAALALAALLCAAQSLGSSVLSPSDHEHSPEITGLFGWLEQNGAKVRLPHGGYIMQGGISFPHSLSTHSKLSFGLEHHDTSMPD